jgi:hypothetical protein
LIDSNTSYSEILKQFKSEGLTANNISKIKAQRHRIITAFESSLSSKAKTLKTTSYPDIEKGLIDFITDASNEGLPVNTAILKEKAIQLANSYGFTDFKASTGFIDKFKSRNEVLFQVFSGEANGVSDELCNDWVSSKLPQLLVGYKPEDIFNGDEFGLFWKLLPNRSFTIKGQKFRTGKRSKDRISVFICANSLGTEKFKPIVIGRSREPRCFRGKASLPVVYKYNRKSWMTSGIFTEFLQNLNKKFKIQNRKIALILDNCPAHPYVAMSNIKLVFLPPNTTSRLQAMDLGVIFTVKSHYRQQFVRRLCAIFESTKRFDDKSIDLYESIIILNNVWKDLSENVIKNCFQKSGLVFDEQMHCEESDQSVKNNEFWEE